MSSDTALSSAAVSFQNGAFGNYSHSEGSGRACGTCSHAEGDRTSTLGSYSHAEGCETYALNDYESACGKYNVSTKSDTNSAKTFYSVGCGPSFNDRQNAHEIKANGDHYVYGIGGYTGNNYSSASTLQTVVNGKLSGVSFNGTTATVTNGVAAINATIPAAVTESTVSG